VDPFFNIVQRMIPGSERRVSLSRARTGGEVSNVMVKWLRRSVREGVLAMVLETGREAWALRS
jgi:hypothetical protein